MGHFLRCEIRYRHIAVLKWSSFLLFLDRWYSILTEHGITKFHDHRLKSSVLSEVNRGWSPSGPTIFREVQPSVCLQHAKIPFACTSSFVFRQKPLKLKELIAIILKIFYVNGKWSLYKLVFCWKQFLGMAKDSSPLFYTIGYCFYCSFLHWKFSKSNNISGGSRLEGRYPAPCSRFVC